IREAGAHEQRAARRYLMVRKAVTASDGDKLARLSPARGRFSVSYTIDFSHPLISDQHLRLDVTEKSFQKEIARARTFGFKRDVERLHTAGLALGGSLENAVVVDDFNILNPEGLRYPDEFVRHKILDALGDLSLIGGARSERRVFVDDALLQPHRRDSQPDRFVDVRADEPAAPEMIGDVDGERDPGEALVHGLAEDLSAVRADGNDPVAVFLQVAGD